MAADRVLRPTIEKIFTELAEIGDTVSGLAFKDPSLVDTMNEFHAALSQIEWNESRELLAAKVEAFAWSCDESILDKLNGLLQRAAAKLVRLCATQEAASSNCAWTEESCADFKDSWFLLGRDLAQIAKVVLPPDDPHLEQFLFIDGFQKDHAVRIGDPEALEECTNGNDRPLRSPARAVQR